MLSRILENTFMIGDEDRHYGGKEEGRHFAQGGTTRQFQATPARQVLHIGTQGMWLGVVAAGWGKK